MSVLPSPASGTVSEILVEEGETVTVGQVIARISLNGGAPAATPAATPLAAPEAPAASRETDGETDGASATDNATDRIG